MHIRSLWVAGPEPSHVSVDYGSDLGALGPLGPLRLSMSLGADLYFQRFAAAAWGLTGQTARREKPQPSASIVSQVPCRAVNARPPLKNAGRDSANHTRSGMQSARPWLGRITAQQAVSVGGGRRKGR